jgi:hypothetical protein
MFSSHGRHRTEVFEAGDTRYIPMGMATRSRMRATRKGQKSSSASTRGNYQGINHSTLEANFPLKPDVTQKLPQRQQFVVPKEGPDA